MQTLELGYVCAARRNHALGTPVASSGAMSINLEQLANLVTTVIRDGNLSAEVVGVMPGEGDGCYTEVILDVRDGSIARRVSLGVQRDAGDEEVRTRISEGL